MADFFPGCSDEKHRPANWARDYVQQGLVPPEVPELVDGILTAEEGKAVHDRLFGEGANVYYSENEENEFWRVTGGVWDGPNWYAPKLFLDRLTLLTRSFETNAQRQSFSKVSYCLYELHDMITPVPWTSPVNYGDYANAIDNLEQTLRTTCPNIPQEHSRLHQLCDKTLERRDETRRKIEAANKAAEKAKATMESKERMEGDYKRYCTEIYQDRLMRVANRLGKKRGEVLFLRNVLGPTPDQGTTEKVRKLAAEAVWYEYGGHTRGATFSMRKGVQDFWWINYELYLGPENINDPSNKGRLARARDTFENSAKWRDFCYTNSSNSLSVSFLAQRLLSLAKIGDNPTGIKDTISVKELGDSDIDRVIAECKKNPIFSNPRGINIAWLVEKAVLGGEAVSFPPWQGAAAAAISERVKKDRFAIDSPYYRAVMLDGEIYVFLGPTWFKLTGWKEEKKPPKRVKPSDMFF